MKLYEQPIHVDLFGRGYDQFGQSPLVLTGTEVNKQVQIIGEAGVPAQQVTTGEMSGSYNIVDGYIQSKDFVSGVSGWRIDASSLEANDGNFRGDITAATGTFSGVLRALSGIIGGFTITAQELYGGIIKTNVSAGAIGSDGVIMDSDGLRGYSSTLGQVFNIPTDGSQPTFSNGVILVSNMYSSNIAGGTVVGAIITGGLFRTAAEGRRIEIDSQGIQAINGALGKTYGDGSALYGDATRLYGSGVLVYINNNDYKIPFYVNQEQDVADIHLYNRSADPTGAAELGDLAVVNGKLKICTVAGEPGGWDVVGIQTAASSPSTSISPSHSPSLSPSVSPSVSSSISPSTS